MVTSPSKSPDRRYAWLCAGIVLAVIALTVPIAESAVNDDWSFTKTALDLAQTGHLLYNGWATPMLGAQAYWGALFIKLFGFSFLAVRLSVTPLAAGCAALLYVLHRRASLPPGLALFGALTITLSPVFIPNAASFMTDIPALFLFLASIYGYVRVADVLDAHEPPAFWRNRLWGWLLFSLSAGLLGGTVRQTNWFVPLLAPGFLLVRCWTFRRLRPALVPLTVSGLIALGGMMAFSAWLKDQPYTVPLKVSTGVIRFFTNEEAPATLVLLLAYMMQTLGVMMIPLLITLPMLYHRWLAGQRLLWLRLGSALILTLFIWFLAWLSFGGAWVFPWLGNSFDSRPFLTGTAPAPPQSIPTTLPVNFWRAFSLTVTALVCGTLALWVVTRMWPRQKRPGEQPRDRMPVVIGLLIVFLAAYLPLLLLKGLLPLPFFSFFDVLDRYLIPVFLLTTMVFLLVFRQWTGRDQLPLAAWSVLVLFGWYGVAQTHDHFAQLRARVAVTQYLEQRGIPRTRIMAGFEYDSWTQLEVAGHYNDPRIEKPQGTFIPPPESPGFVTMYPLWRFTPVVHPDYVVVLVRHPDLLVTDVPPTDFWCWLPPFRHHLEVQVRDPALAAVNRLPMRRAPPASIH